MKSDFIRKLFWFNVALALLEGLFVLWQYIRIPSEAADAVFLGFSLLRLVILSSVLLALLAVASVLFLSFRAEWWDSRGVIITRLLDRTGTFWLLFLVFISIYIFLFSSEHYLGNLVIHRTRLTPTLVWAMLVSFQGLISFLILRAYELHTAEKYSDVLRPTVVAFILLGVLSLFVLWTRIGLTPDTLFWQGAGVPLLFLQVLSIGMIGALIYTLFSRIDAVANHRIDIFIFLFLWLLAFGIWQSQGVASVYNRLDPAPPNFQAYPFGDAMLYDVTAQSFLIGKPIPADFWAKPLYSFFLSILHVLAGQDFNRVVLLQVAAFAVIPACVYGVTRILGGRLAGILAALLVIWRERNGIALSNVIEVSHSKLLLSDVFAMGGMVLLLCLLLWWLENPSARRSVPVAIGGSIGLLILVRGHPILIVPVLFLIAAFFTWRDRQLLWESLWKLALGLAIVLLPWFWHTYDLTGRFAFQDNTSSFAGKDLFVQSFNESSATDTAAYQQFESQIFQQVLQHPIDVAQFVSAHYFHNTVFSYVLLPQSFQIDSLRSYVNHEPFWGRGNGQFSSQAWVLIFINIAILAVGMGAAWKKTKASSIVPLLIGSVYNVSVAIARRSGWRLIMPADWITLIFYAIGMAQIIMLVYALLKRTDVPDTLPPSQTSSANPPSLILTGMPFLFIALALVMGHKLFPAAYPAQKTSHLIEMYQNATMGMDTIAAAQIDRFLQDEDATVIYGRALYPVYLKPNVGAYNYSWLSFSSKPYARIAFYVIGPQPTGVILPLDSTPMIFPDGADVIVLGCKTESGDINALSVLITSTSTPILYEREPFPELACPFPE